MDILHAHYQPPLGPGEASGVVFWLENSHAPAPAASRGRAALKPKPKAHPFSARPGLSGKPCEITLRLPAVKGIPLPSPQLILDWEIERENPSLAAFIIQGEWFAPAEAAPILLGLSSANAQPAADFEYWRMVAALVLESLAAQKLLPILETSGNGQAFFARWLTVLDSGRDAQRLAQLEAAMPAVCRAETHGDPEQKPASPRSLLHSFLNTFGDALARAWGKPGAPKFSRSDDSVASRWIEALFNANAEIKAAPAPLRALAGSQRAWLRNLHVAGDAAFRIAFRLEAPAQPKEAWLLHYLIQAKDDPSLLIPAEEVWSKTQGALTHLGHRFEQPQEKLLAGLGYAARLLPPIADSLKSKLPTQLQIDAERAYTFLRETAPLLEGAGFGILIPPWWNKKGARLGLKVKMNPQKGQNAIAKGDLSLQTLVRYQWKLSIGDTELSEEEFLALARLKSPLVQIRGQWVSLDAEQIEAAIKFWQKQQIEGEMGMLEAMRLGLGGETSAGGLPIEEVIPEGWLGEWLARFAEEGRLETLPQPGALQGELRPYQRYGYSWLQFHLRWGLGACLADDMGLGKTIQTIALLLHEQETLGELPAPALLIAPTSVVTNWAREINRFAPSLRAYVHRGGERLHGDEFHQAIRDQHIVLTSYPVARLDAEALQAVNWMAVILDEAQNIKNPSAKQTQVIRKLNAGFRIALTGTPVENRLSELWSIMHFLNPGYLGSQAQFRQQFALPIERYNDKAAVQQLRQLTTPFILRRVKTDPSVISDLPEKVETKEYCSLTEEQATLYQAVVQDAMQRIETEDGIQRRGLVLSMLMQLKQICNHPVQYLHQAGKDSAGGALEGRSGKLERMGELLEELLAEGERALIFTQFAEMGALLANYLPTALGTAVQFLHGSTPAKTRDQMVKRFQEEDQAPSIFILSLKAGGTGLNLTRASHVFHYDRWWNPAVEDQATDRAFRIGQKRNVQVHKFVVTGSLEEKIDDMLQNKKGLAQAVVGGGENWLTELSTAELRQVVSLRREG